MGQSKTTQPALIADNSKQPRILFLDIETFPNVAYVWGKYDQNVIDFVREGCIATYAAKWNDGPVFAKSLPDYPGYMPNSYDDLALVRDLWALIDEADIIVAHHGDAFDIPTIQGRFIVHGLTPPAPFKTVDTRKIAKRVGRFNSNKLDDLGQTLGEGRKIKTDFELWKGCIDGDPAAWAKMIRYNKKDVALLARVYWRLLPWINDHPNHALHNPDAICPKCGSAKVQYRGTAVALTRRYQRFQCMSCGGWGRLVKCEKGSTVQHTNVA